MVEGAHVTRVSTKKGAPAAKVEHYGGEATEVRLSGGADATLTHLGVRQVTTHSDAFDVLKPAVGVAVDWAGLVTIEHDTVTQIETPGGAPGYVLQVAQTKGVKVRNCLLGGAPSQSVHTPGKSSVAVSWSSLFEGPAGDLDGGTGVTALPPTFVSPTSHHVTATSPSIDVGAPSTPFGSEPPPNGCAPDLGVYGGTAEATPAPGAPSCTLE